MSWIESYKGILFDVQGIPIDLLNQIHEGFLMPDFSEQEPHELKFPFCYASTRI